MSMRVNTIVTHLRTEDALTLIEFLDQVRDVLTKTYRADIRTMLQAAGTVRQARCAEGEDEPF
jgi:hypothetical protein